MVATATGPLPTHARGPAWWRKPEVAERFAWAVTGYNVLVVVWGALVRATGSGAGCGNHWPLCNGQVVPLSPTLHTVIEFTHRMMVGGATFAMIALVVLVWKATAKGWAARWFACAAAVLLVNEAFLGALLVKLDYVITNRSLGRVVVLSVHLSNTLLLLAALTLTAWMLHTQQRRAELRATRSLRVIVLGGLVATLVVGVSGSLAALGDTLFPAATLRVAMAQDFSASSPLLLRLRGLHPASALVAAAFVLWLLGRARRLGLRRGALLVGSLLAAQFVLGIADVLLLAPTWMQLLHLLGADLYWVALVTLSAQSAWPGAGDAIPAADAELQTDAHRTAAPAIHR